MAGKYSWRRQLGAALRFPLVRLLGYPMLVNLEVTRMCNARCDFCRYWKTRKETRLDDYGAVVRKLKPAVVMITGGEALLRRDLETIVAGVRRACPYVHMGLVTNGWLLTVERGLALWRAGLDQLTISLDFLDERHDRARGLPGLSKRILTTAPALVARGIDNLVVQTVIRADNLESVPEVIAWAAANGIKVSLSAYTPGKNGNHTYTVPADQLAALERLVGDVTTRRNGASPIVSSRWYLKRVLEYFRCGEVPGCTSGRRFVTVSPAGDLQRCSEMPVECHYTEWHRRRFAPTECGACWVSCRGECQAPLDWSRVRRAVALYHRPAGSPAALRSQEAA
jgi:MoaA/NifB/PqqE/SkfB family radical SAM enzyme